jgi:hypothetical protein
MLGFLVSAGRVSRHLHVHSDVFLCVGNAILVVAARLYIIEASCKLLMFCACFKKLHIRSKVLQNCSRDAEVFCVQVCTYVSEHTKHSV